MNVVKLNGKWKAWPQFCYSVSPTSERICDRNSSAVFHFETVKQWCVETWGDTPILDIWLLGCQHPANAGSLNNQHWSFDVSNRNGIPVLRLYFKGDQELSLYKLKWS